MKPLSVQQGLKKYLDITTLLIYCQLLIGTTPDLVWPIRAVCCTPAHPEAKNINLKYCSHEYILPPPLLKAFL